MINIRMKKEEFMNLIKNPNMCYSNFYSTLLMNNYEDLLKEY